MMFCVSVPVLSEQMHEVDPSVSTPSRFFTSTIFECMRRAVSVRHTVTVASRPSGTLATMMEIRKTRFSISSVPSASPMMKKVTPRKMAMEEMIRMKWWISLLIGVCWAPTWRVSEAMRPMTVSSPMFTTTPSREPSGTFVPKKARFAVSSGSSCVASFLRFWGSASPVSEALSTTQLSVQVMMRTSQGTSSPPSSRITSPLTSFSEGTLMNSPLRLALIEGGSSFSKLFIRFSLLLFWKKLKQPVTKTTAKSTMPRYMLSTSLRRP
mmetsp:Transcript_41175/g.93064  ORF Transcript_41175/g.93064 Transcript_41175/m.93064 type:complete len:267 (-) Transcript_41175:381-1181(-)